MISKHQHVKPTNKYGTIMNNTTPETLENAWLIHIEIHVGNDTRHLHQVIYATSEAEAQTIMSVTKPDYRGNVSPDYSLQIKSGPWKLTENHEILTEY